MTAAFPQFSENPWGKPSVHGGATLREWFAAQAPAKVPRWFTFDEETPVPPSLHWRHTLSKLPAFAALPPADRAELLEWMQDPYDHLDKPDLQAIGEAAHRAVGEREAAIVEIQRANEARRYFAWRWHYADRMLDQAGRTPEQPE